MKLNWFSPPPAPGAAWAGAVLTTLCRQADVVIWTDQPTSQPWPAVAAHVRHFRPEAVPWAEIHRAELSVYHLGDDVNRYGGIWQVCRHDPGVVVLHDISLVRLVVGVFRRLHDFAGYGAVMERCYGPAGGRLAGMIWQQDEVTADLTDRCPHTRPAVEGALGVLVHTRAAHAALRSAGRWPLAFQPPPDGEARSTTRPYVDELLRLCGEAMRYRLQAAHYRLAERAAAAMSAWAGPRAEALGEHVARHIVGLTG